MIKNFTIVFLTALLTSCGTNMGIVRPMGQGVYTLTGNGRNGYIPLGKIRKKVFEEADAYAKARNTTLEVIAVNEVKMSFGVYPQIDLTFQLVNESIKVADPNNINQKTTIKSTSANGQSSYKQVVSKENIAKKNDDVYDSLLKLKKLKDEEVLTEEEFVREKKKILNQE